MNNRKKYSFTSQMMLFFVLLWKYFRQKKRTKQFAKQQAAKEKLIEIEKKKDSQENIKNDF
ncbi:MAG: hypothetical protein ACOX1F_02880 [Erysipelotrichaceae bacterium]|jgi:hypothetical protein